MYFILFYKTVDNYLQEREPYREQHFEYVKASIARGEFKMGGAYADPADGAVLIFTATDRAVIEDFARSDPYVLSGVVTDWHVRAWNMVIQA